VAITHTGKVVVILTGLEILVIIIIMTMLPLITLLIQQVMETVFHFSLNVVVTITMVKLVVQKVPVKSLMIGILNV